MNHSFGENSQWWTHLPRTNTINRAVIYKVCALIATAFIISILLRSHKDCIIKIKTKMKIEDTNAPIILDEVCFKSSCIDEAKKIKEKMDEEIDPCDDFYTFSCGNFIKNTIIPDDTSDIDEFTIVADKVQTQLKAIMSEPASKNEIEPFKKLKFFYQICMIKKEIQIGELQSLINTYDKIGGWPVIKDDEWDETKWTWQQAIKNTRKYEIKIDFIFKVYVSANLKKSSLKSVLNIDQADFGLNREYLIEGLKNNIVQAYHSYQVDMAVIFGADRIRAEKEMREVLDFEIALANISKPKEERRNFAFYNLISIQELQIKYPYNNWLEYIENFFSLKNLNEEDQELDIIVNHDTNFFKELGPLLERTSKRTLANYIMWRMTKSSYSSFNEALKKRKYQFYDVIYGIKTPSAHWKSCINEAVQNYPILVGALYVRKYFQKNTKDLASEMVDSIQEEFRTILRNVSWLDVKTRSSALTKLENMATYVGYPDELLNDQKLIEHSKKETDKINKYFESNIISTDGAFKNMKKHVEKIDWTKYSNAASVNAYYMLTENTIQIPAAILQGHFFSADRPNYLNYAGIGFSIGHEITHGYDDKGRQFDKDGKLNDWWTEESKNAFLERARCIVEQYGNFTDPEVGLKINGILTEGENIADNSAIRKAYFAYQRYIKRNGSDLKLPNLKYTPNQLFWISTAQTWCNVIKPETLKYKITTDVHSPNRFRVLGPLRNMKEFSKDFNCPAGSPMNPAKKCEVW